jgi:type I restriction enzyme, S subunit
VTKLLGSISQSIVKRDFYILSITIALYARSYYASEASGTSDSMKNVSRPVIYALPISLPPLAEQHRIVAKVDELMALCDRLETQLSTTQANSRRLLESLLHKAIAGAT